MCAPSDSPIVVIDLGPAPETVVVAEPAGTAAEPAGTAATDEEEDGPGHSDNRCEDCDAV